MGDSPTDKLRRDVAEQIRAMRYELPRLEAAYEALGGDLASLPNGNARSGPASVAMSAEVIPSIARRVAERLRKGKCRTQSLVDWLRTEHGIDVGREELIRELESSKLRFDRGERGWWSFEQGSESS